MPYLSPAEVEECYSMLPYGDAPAICFHRVVELSRRITPT